MLKFLLALFLIVAAVSSQQCGPPQCYPHINGCTQTSPTVDFVFMIDVSGSMANPISGVQQGLSSFAGGLAAQNIIPKFSLVIFGSSNQNGLCWLDLNAATSASAFSSRMNYWVGNTGGGVEPGLETFRCALNVAATNNLNIAYTGGQNSQKVFVLVTNEDSDPPVANANDNFNGNAQPQTWLNDHCYQAGQTNSPCDFNGIVNANQIPSSTWNSAYQAEINLVASSLISNSVPVYMFVAGSQSIGCNKDVLVTQTCNTHYQYCNPDAQSQNSDFTNFNAAATYSTMVSNGWQYSLQGQLLNAGVTMRCFDVYATGNPNLVKNFFQQITADISKCQTSCYDYLCQNGVCLPPTNQCGCDGVKYSGKVSDGHGGCCLPSQMDCAGYCAGTHSYDNCGVCILTGSGDSYCAQDCAGNYYLTGVPPTNYIIANSYHFDVAGYLLMNADVKNAYITSWKNAASITQHFHDHGMFEGRSYCTFDLSFYTSQYGSFSQSAAEADWVASLLTGSPRNAQCVAGSQRRFPAVPTDPCGQCVPNASNPPYCVKDCSGNYRTSQGASWFTDNCGVCVAPGTDANANKDSCGVCFGGNASKNQCGVCGGSKSLDACGQPVCQNLVCHVDCDGVSRNPLTHYVNNCGTCVLNGQTDPRCVQDCAGTWYNNTNTAPHHLDECGNCVPQGTPRAASCVQDCSGAWGGNAVYDACGQCVVHGVPPHQCLQDCAGAYYTSVQQPPHSIDSCGICNLPANANSLKDRCGVCTNKAGYNTTSDCTPDCKGVWSLTTSNGRAFTDVCGQCWFANQSSSANSWMDSCGNCWPGGSSNPNWNSGSGTVDSNGHPCKCGQNPKACPGGNTTCIDTCPPVCPGYTTPPDRCGLCPNDTMYGKVDSCGLCCNPPSVPCDTAKDACGICFGFNASLNNPCGICDPTGTLCTKDCNGVYGGTAKVGCNGVCGYTGACANCGDGKVESPETCDLGTDAQGHSKNVAGSGCSPKCQTEAGANIGAAVGGAIGGVAAIVALGIAAFFALRYAQKAGLIGNANKQVDFGASNSNPLYQSEVSVHQNPLYDTK